MNATTPLTISDLILSHLFSSAPPGSVVLRTARWEVRQVDQVIGTVTADTRDDARAAAAERWGGDADAYLIRYVGSTVEHFTVTEEEEDRNAA